EIVEPHTQGNGDAFAADDAFAVAQRRDGVEETARAFGHRGPDTGLVAVVVEAHGDDRTALRQHAFGKVRRTLRDQAQADAVFTAFLGDPLEDPAHRLAGADVVLGDVAMSLFADEEDRPLGLGSR